VFTPGFSNNEIQGLKEIALPDPVAYTPQTIGWYSLFAAALILIVWLSYRGYRRWMANRYRTFALRRLDDIEQELRQPDSRINALTAIPVLIKQTALKCYRRAEIAQMSGKEWLAFLDKSYGGTGFSRGVGQLLPDLSYQAAINLEQIESARLRELLSLIKEWIRKHNSYTGVLE
jgi:hypothetical protein